MKKWSHIYIGVTENIKYQDLVESLKVTKVVKGLENIGGTHNTFF